MVVALWEWIELGGGILFLVILIVLAIYNKITAYTFYEMEDFRRGKYPHQFRNKYYLRQVMGTTRTANLYKTVWGMVFGGIVKQLVKGVIWELPDLNGFVWGNKELFAYRGITGKAEDDNWIFIHPPLIGGMTAKRTLDDLYKLLFVEVKNNMSFTTRELDEFKAKVSDAFKENDQVKIDELFSNFNINIEKKTTNLFEKLTPEWLMKVMGIPLIETRDILPRSTRLGFVKIAENLVKFRADHEDLMGKILANFHLIILAIFCFIIVIAIVTFFQGWTQYQAGWSAYFNAVYERLAVTLNANHIYGFNVTLPTPPGAVGVQAAGQPLPGAGLIPGG